MLNSVKLYERVMKGNFLGLTAVFEFDDESISSVFFPAYVVNQADTNKGWRKLLSAGEYSSDASALYVIEDAQKLNQLVENYESYNQGTSDSKDAMKEYLKNIELLIK